MLESDDGGVGGDQERGREIEGEREREEQKQTCDDNGEFSAGAILAACLRNCEKNYKDDQGSTGNILLVITRKVSLHIATSTCPP